MENQNLSLENLTEVYNGITYYEQWKDIIEFDGQYQISNFGRIKGKERYVNSNYSQSGLRRIQESIKCLQNNGHGYLQIYVSLNRKRKVLYIHRLVGKYFIPNPQNKPEINHINGIKCDNRVFMLEWSTKKENISHAHKTGLFILPRGKSPSVIYQITNNGRVKWDSAKTAAMSLNIDESGIRKCCKGKLKSVKGFTFSLYE